MGRKIHMEVEEFNKEGLEIKLAEAILDIIKSRIQNNNNFNNKEKNNQEDGW